MPPSFACVPSQSHLNINPASVTSPTTTSSSSTTTTTDVSNVYQVDYTCVNAGKTLGMTKRRVRFRFGFADTQALLSGEKAGADCRGEEHEIIINWSLASGKQQVLCDGHEIFYEVRPRESVLTCAWRFRGNHVLKVVGYAKPSTMRQAGTKQFNIFLDEVSFYDFLPIYAIGTTRTRPSSYYPEKNYQPVVSHSNHKQYNIDTEAANEYYDEKGLQQQHQAVTTPSTVASFQSYEGESGEPNNNYADLLDMADDSVVYYNTTVPPSQQQQQQLPVNDPFSYPPASAAVEVDPENERRSKLAEINQQLTMAIQNTHISAAAPPTITTHAIVQSQTQSSYYASEAYSNASYPSQEPVAAPAPVPVLLDENQETSDTEEKSGDNAFDDMMKKLVNVEDITSEPEHLQNSKLSMKPLALEKKKKNASNNKQQEESYGPQPTLSQLKAVSSSTVKGLNNNNKEIMKPSNHLPNNNNVSYQGALVVHGASPSPHYNHHAHQDMNSAPPLMRQVGFGVGASYQQQYGQAPQQAYYARSC